MDALKESKPICSTLASTDAAASTQLALEAAERTIEALMDQVESLTATAGAPTGLNVEMAMMNKLVRSRTQELERVNSNLIAAGARQKQTDRLLRQMQVTAEIAGWAYDAATGRIDVTDHFEKLVGCDVNGLTFDQFIRLFERENFDSLTRAFTSSRPRGAPFDVDARRTVDGNARTFRLVGKAAAGAADGGGDTSGQDGRPAFSVHGVLLDVTVRRSQENQLLQAGRLEAIGQLAAGVAHEINTPIQYISDNTHFVKENLDTLLDFVQRACALCELEPGSKRLATGIAELDDLRHDLDLDFLAGEIPQALSESQDGLDRVAKIVRAMKQFSHPGSSEPEPADLNEAVRATVEVARMRWKHVATVELALDPDLPQVPCVISEINQVVLNLVVNAADALQEQGGRQGEIRVTTRVDGGFVSIIVADNGPGIPEAIRDRIFDAFFTTKPPGVGTGQGLALSHNIVVIQHQGKLSCESSPGQGTSFQIQLPLNLCTSKEAK